MNDNISISNEQLRDLQVKASINSALARRLNATQNEIINFAEYLNMEGTISFPEFLGLRPEEQRQIFKDFKAGLI